MANRAALSATEPLMETSSSSWTNHLWPYIQSAFRFDFPPHWETHLIFSYIRSWELLSLPNANVVYILQCGVCAKALGDLVTLIFLHDKVIHCNDCFQKAVNVWILLGTNVSQSSGWIMCCLRVCTALALYCVCILFSYNFFLWKWGHTV